MADAAEPLNVSEFEGLARQPMEPAAYDYFAGGAGDERTLSENLAGFGRLALRRCPTVDRIDRTLVASFSALRAPQAG